MQQLLFILKHDADCHDRYAVVLSAAKAAVLALRCLFEMYHSCETVEQIYVVGHQLMISKSGALTRMQFSILRHPFTTLTSSTSSIHGIGKLYVIHPCDQQSCGFLPQVVGL